MSGTVDPTTGIPDTATAIAGGGGGIPGRPVAGGLSGGERPGCEPPAPPAPPTAYAGDDWLGAFIGNIVVCDLDDHFLVIGTLVHAAADHLSFAQADLHDHREANSTREVYVIESRKIGVRVNRHKVWIPRSRLVAISLLDDVVM